MDLVTVLFIFLCFLLVCVVLLQPGKGDGAGAITFGGSSQSIFGSRGAGNFLTKTTAILATIFFVGSFSITKVRLAANKPTNVRENYTPPTSPTPAPSGAPAAVPSGAPKAETPAAPAAPAKDGKK